MALEVSLSPEKDSVLRAEASRRGLPLQKLAKELLEDNLPESMNGGLPADEEERLLDELAKLGRDLPPTTTSENYSRETIYADHD